MPIFNFKTLGGTTLPTYITGRFLTNDGTNLSWAANGSGDLKSDGTIPLAADWNVGNFSLTGKSFTSDVAIGTAPFVATSTTVCTNLNADLLDGIEGSALVKADGTVPLTANWNVGAFRITANSFSCTGGFYIGTYAKITSTGNAIFDLNDNSIAGNNPAEIVFTSPAGGGTGVKIDGSDIVFAPGMAKGLAHGGNFIIRSYSGAAQHDNVMIGSEELTFIASDGTTDAGYIYWGDAYFELNSVGETWYSTYNASEPIYIYSEAASSPISIQADASPVNLIGTVLNFSTVTEYADNAAAVAGGLAAGDVYRTGDILKIVH